ncbi:BTAD domain-containing putative transcriptional regulator [Streptomyces luteireticuli]|uniref:AfsR/SARP family transcriptional regulator n=1 Tax=Streptomyces luteireticuli TaxID=173858 RepID=UPI003558646E
MRFNLLGQLQVHDEGRILTPQAHKLRVLLAALLVHHHTVLSIDVLIDELWPQGPPRTALQALRVYISQLRKIVHGGSSRGELALVSEPPGYYLAVGEGMLDLAEFDRHRACARAAREEQDHRAALQHYRAAARLWRSVPLADLREGTLLKGAASRLEEAWMTAQEERLSLELRHGTRRGEVIAELRELVVRHPFNEHLHALLMIGLFLSGRSGDALQVYRTTRKYLIDELGIEPGDEIRAVHQLVLDSDRSALRAVGMWTA